MLFHESLIRAHLAETLDEAIHDVEVTCQQFRATGYGRLYVSKGRLLLDLYMDTTIPDQDRGMYYAEDVPKLTGRLSNGSQLTVEWLSTSRCTSSSRSDRFHWRSSAAVIRIELTVEALPEDVAHKPTIQGFVPAGDGTGFWKSVSRVVDNNPHFGWERHSADWLLYENALVQIPIRRHDEDLWAYRVNPTGEEQAANVHSVSNRVLVALGITLGRQVRHNATYVEDGRRIIAELRAPHRPLGRVTMLVPTSRQAELFSRSMDYLLKLPDDHGLFACLNAYWNSAANFWPLTHLLLASATEGLAKVYEPDRGLTARERFTALAARLGTGISDSEFESWQTLRNALAHGSYAELGGDRATGEHGTRIKNVFNKILLAVIGYTGPYIDYAAPGWPAVQFRPASTEPQVAASTASADAESSS